VGKAIPVPVFLGALQRHRQIYGYTLRAELVYALNKALDEDPDLELEPRFIHVLADEYQDLNRCEIAVLQRLVGTDRSMFAAGDDDQSIYGFRKAFPLGLREFNEKYADAQRGELAECHRCDDEILQIALTVAAQDENRIPKQLHALEGATGAIVEAHSYRTSADEAEGIALICRSLVDAHGVVPGQIMILVRNDP
jgi:DNA helicase-2/ATP-dependent DNA helicase PcrA